MAADRLRAMVLMFCLFSIPLDQRQPEVAKIRNRKGETFGQPSKLCDDGQTDGEKG